MCTLNLHNLVRHILHRLVPSCNVHLQCPECFPRKSCCPCMVDVQLTIFCEHCFTSSISRRFSTLNFFSEFQKSYLKPSYEKLGLPARGSNDQSSDYKSNALTTRPQTATGKYFLFMTFVASPDPNPNPRGGGQLPNPKSVILC